MPGTDFADIVMEMDLRLRVEIGRVALRTMSFTNTRSYKHLKRDLHTGRCALLMDGQGIVECISFLLAFRKTRWDVAMFVQLGKITPSSVVASCALPSTKLSPWDLSNDAVCSAFASVLGHLAPFVDIMNCERQTEYKETASVRYLMTQCNGVLMKDVGDSLQRFIVGEHDFEDEIDHGFNTAVPKPGWMYWSTESPAMLRKLRNRKVSVYAWMSECEFAAFKREETEPTLTSFLATLDTSSVSASQEIELHTVDSASLSSESAPEF